MKEREGHRCRMVILLSAWSEVHSTLASEGERPPHLFIPSIWLTTWTTNAQGAPCSQQFS